MNSGIGRMAGLECRDRGYWDSRGGCVDGWLGVWMVWVGCMDGWLGEWVDGWVSGWMVWVGVWLDG